MSNENWKIQISPKTPSGTLINIRGETPEEVQALLAGVHELVILVVGLEQAFAGVTTVAPLSTGPSTVTQFSTPSSTQAFPSTPPVAQAPLPTCSHGERKFLTGNKNGKQWSMWACPTPKDAPGKCDPVWA